jgi:hypothetical protein
VSGTTAELRERSLARAWRRRRLPFLLLGGLLVLAALSVAWRPIVEPARDGAPSLWNRLAAPGEVNAFARLPVIQFDLRAIATLDGGQTLIAVGAGGIARSADGGRRWAGVEMPAGIGSPRLNAVVAIPGTRALVAVGDDSVILRSENAGAS